jgi:hypothetical protein
VDELIDRLKPTEERLNRSNNKSIVSLNLTEGELVARVSSWLKISGNDGLDRSKEVSSRGGKRGRGRGRSHGSNTGGRTENHSGGDSGDHGGNTSHGNAAGSSDVTKDECCYYGKRGHWACECRKKKRDEEAHATQVDEEGESTLLLASATISELNSIPEHAPVHLDKGKLFVQLGDKVRPDHSWWILDSGAMNHMTGEHSMFTKIDHKVHGTVRFGDGAIADIKGKGTILLKYKTGEHKTLAGVYLIPRLTANIVSLGQLEQDGHKIVLHVGSMRI